MTSHGLALNCDVDLQWYSHVVPCGVEDKGVTSLSEELKRPVSIKDAVKPLLSSFCQQFECNIVPIASTVKSKIINQLIEESVINVNDQKHLSSGNTWLEE